jgi:hypothetical protein
MQRSAIAETEQANSEIADEFFIGDRLASDVDASSPISFSVRLAGPQTVYTEPIELGRFMSRQYIASARSRPRPPDQYGSSPMFEAFKKNKKANFRQIEQPALRICLKTRGGTLEGICFGGCFS